MRGIGGRARVMVKLFIRLIPGYALFFFSILALGLLYGNIVGIIILFITFVSLRYKYDNSITFHADSSKNCLALSILLFVISGIPLIVFAFDVSMLSAIPIGIGMTWILYQFGLKNKLAERVSELEFSKPFDLDNCTEEELRARCKERFKRDVEYKTERAIKHFILKLPHEEIDVNPEQSKKERYRFRKILK